MKKNVILWCLSFFAGQACAQEDYMITETSCHQEKVTQHRKDQFAFRKHGIEGYTMYSLADVKEFRIGNTIYQAVTVNGSRDHYIRVEKGRNALCSGTRMYSQKDGSSHPGVIVASHVLCAPELQVDMPDYDGGLIEVIIESTKNGSIERQGSVSGL